MLLDTGGEQNEKKKMKSTVSTHTHTNKPKSIQKHIKYYKSFQLN